MERTIEQKLAALLKLQTIDSKLDEITKVRGDLPEEVQDLEDEIAGYNTRVQKFQGEIAALNEEIDKKKQAKKDAEKLITKYKDQQMNVRNNREYEALVKEIESEELEMQLCDKRIKESHDKIAQINVEIEGTNKTMEERLKDLNNKKAELNNIMQESEEDENKIIKEREKHIKNIDERLYRSYAKIRQNALNGLAVVMVRRDACGGCFNIVPLQRQADIREKKKLIVCEHCGRIFAGVEEIVVAEEKTAKTLKKPTTSLKKSKVAEEEEELE